MTKSLLDSVPRFFLCTLIWLKAPCILPTGLVAPFTWADAGLLECLVMVMAYLWARARRASYIDPLSKPQFVLTRLWMRLRQNAGAAIQRMQGGAHSYMCCDCARGRKVLRP